MTKGEYNRRLVALQTELLDRNKAENERHNAEIGRHRSEFRAAVAALQAEFRSNTDGTVADLREMGTPIRPASV